MLQLKPAFLDRGLAATLHHGYGTFFPEPPEILIVRKHWDSIRTILSKTDLDTYSGYDPIRSFAPKSRLNVRRVALLHPFDFVLYTSLVLALKRTISKHRLLNDRVFSYRPEGSNARQLYGSTFSFTAFRDARRRKADQYASGYVGVTDIADFYPRIYQHRLYNALETASTPSEKPYVRALNKMLSKFSEGNSYGIPVGPPASRLLAEAVLIDVDSALMSYSIDFLRFVDDYVIFARTPEEAEFGIRMLGETLFLNHGLTLQTAKTHIRGVPEYIEKDLTLHSEKEINRRNLLSLFDNNPYEEPPSYEDLGEDDRRQVDAFNLSGMLIDALGDGEQVDYREVSFILSRLAGLQKAELIPTVLDNLDRLFPVADAVAAFFTRFESLTPNQRREIGAALLKPILRAHERRTPDYYSIWALSVFQHRSDWNHAEELLTIFKEARSDVVKRFAALALARSGSRAQALAVREYLSAASPLCRTAMLLATANLGRDERKHLRSSLRLEDDFEKLCSETTLPKPE